MMLTRITTDRFSKRKAEMLAKAAALRKKLPRLGPDLADQYKRAGRP